MIEVSGRLLLASILIAAATAKVGSADVQLWGRAVLLLEYALAMGLLVGVRRANSAALAFTAAFVFVTLAVGIWRARGAQGLETPCGCFGHRLPFATWQQLLLSSCMLIVLGVVSLARDSLRSKEGRGVGSKTD